MRDLRKDLEICNAATPGKWNYELDGDTACVFAVQKDITDYSLSENDARFIAEARTGWPEAIQRALAAEAEVERLRAEDDANQGTVNRLGGEVLRLQAEVKRLRGLLEWARESIYSGSTPQDHDCGYIYRPDTGWCEWCEQYARLCAETGGVDDAD